jgi:probable addiction module antidote protein
MLKASSSHQQGLIDWLKANPQHQQDYLKTSLEDNYDMPEAILLAIKDIAEARGYEAFARDAGLSQNSLYKILDEEKDAKPRFETIIQLFTALGLRMTVEPINTKVS